MKYVKLFNNYLSERKLDKEYQWQHYETNNKLIAYHGSPHDFDEFDSGMFGEGEGASGFGHGIYLSDEYDDAEDYARKLEREEGEGRIYTCEIPSYDLMLPIRGRWEDYSEYVQESLMKVPNKYKIKICFENGFDFNEIKEEYDNDIESGEIEFDNESEYKIHLQEILDDEFQSLGNYMFDAMKNALGSYIYDDGEYKASELLKKVGIKGIIHSDFGNTNYVIFDDSDIKILDKEVYSEIENYSLYEKKLIDAKKELHDFTDNLNHDTTIDDLMKSLKATKLDSKSIFPSLKGNERMDTLPDNKEFIEDLEDMNLKLSDLYDTDNINSFSRLDIRWYWVFNSDDDELTEPVFIIFKYYLGNNEWSEIFTYNVQTSINEFLDELTLVTLELRMSVEEDNKKKTKRWFYTTIDSGNTWKLMKDKKEIIIDNEKKIVSSEKETNSFKETLSWTEIIYMSSHPDVKLFIY